MGCPREGNLARLGRSGGRNSHPVLDPHRQDLIESFEVRASLPVRGQEGIQIDEMSDALRDTVSRARNCHASVAVADQDYVAQVFAFDDRHDVLNMSAQVGMGACQVSALAKAG
jgi:hypothetical protein